MRTSRTLADLGEDALVARIARAARATEGPGVVLGVGDDAALLRLGSGEELVVSTDARVEGVHFRWHQDTPRSAGRTALVAALSDLAAMGARPLGFTWSLAAPARLALWRFDGLLRGLVFEARHHGCPLVGGNLSRARETSLTLGVLGAVPRGRALRREARAGDGLFVTGRLGTAALARARAGRGGRPRVPEARLAAGRALARLGAVRGCIDLSDGLEIDLGRLLGPELTCPFDPAALPTPRGFAAACRRVGLDPRKAALAGGEDYELLFSVRPSGPGAAVLARRLELPVAFLGRVVRGRGGASPGRGFHHFGAAGSAGAR